MAFKYQSRDTATWDKRASMQSGDFQGIIKDDFKTFSPKKGDNNVRILPATWEYKKKGEWWAELIPHYGLDIWVHYSVGPENATVLCLSKMRKKPCPVCEAKDKMEKSGDTEGAKELRAAHRILVWMLDRSDTSAGPMIWSVPFTLDQEFTRVSKDRETGAMYEIDHPEQGYNISFERAGDRLTTKYVGIQLGRRATSVDEDILEYIQNEPLPNCLIWRDYNEVNRLYTGGLSSDSDSEDDLAAERPKKAAEAPEEAPKQQSTRPNFKAGAGAKAQQKEPDDPPPNEDEEGDEDASNGAEPEEEEVKASPPPPSGKSTADTLRARFGRR